MSQSQARSGILILTVIAGIGSAQPAAAQRTLSYTESDYNYRNGIELFEKSNYGAARYEFRQYLDRRKASSNSTEAAAADQNVVDAEYHIALASLYLDEPGSEVLVDRFVKNHSQHPKAGQLYGDLGQYYYEREDYTKAIDFLEKAIAQNSTGGQLTKNKYRLAIAYFNTQDVNRALPLLNQIKLDPDAEDAPAASYYAGVINYRNNNFTEAVADFKRIAQNPTYQNDVPNWIAQSLYRERRFDELLSYTEPLLRRGGNTLSDVGLVTAEVYYQQGKFDRAIPYYKQYIGAKGAKVPGAVKFRYGQSLFRTGKFEEAIAQLKPVASGKDTVAQYAAYTMGISYLQAQNPTYALTSFDQAGRLSFSKAIQEEAQFNHAKVQLDLNNGTDAVKELNAFLKRYPDSPFENEANELLSEAYFASNNYPAAIAYIEKLKRRTPKILATYQRLTYNQAVNDYNAERYAQAQQNFDKSLSVQADTDLRQQAQFWKAETYSAQKQYDTAIPLYASIAKNPGDLGSKSLYALGYAYYNKKDYPRALTYFRDFIGKTGQTDDASVVEDARVRLADTYFATKQYNEAMRTYDEVIARSRGDRDYATYQRGLILSYVGRDVEAKAEFDKLQRQYPGSRFIDDALFQTANVDFEKGAYQVAVRGFTKLITDRPKSYLIPSALLKRATAFSNLQTYDQAIADYRRILNEYGSSDQAQGALLGLQNALNDAGRPEDFSGVLGQYKKANPGSSDVEKVEFDNAKNIYFSEKYPQAIQSLLAFMQEYPTSPNLSEARYYLGESYRQTKDVANALRYYNIILTEGKSEFATRAATRAAELETSQKNYAKAIRNYQFVLAQANGKNEQVAAQLGLMDTYFVEPKLDSAAFYAREVIATGNVVPGAQNRAQLMLGKVALAKSDYKTATTEFEKTVALAKDVYGAEANFLMGDVLYRQKKYKESIAMLLKFNETFGEFDYWKGKAFILVSDNNVGLNEVAQARAVLNSIIENAEDPRIVAEAKTKLAALENKN